MRSRLGKFFLSFSCFLILLIFFSPYSVAVNQEDCENKLGKGELSLNESIVCEQLLKKLHQEAGAQKKSLESEIKKFNTSIALTTDRILQTTKEISKLEEEIGSLSVKIGRLDLSLDQLSEILIGRIAETYKKSHIDPLAVFFSSRSFSEFVSRYKYLSAMQLHDRRLMVQMETARADYEDQKTVKEEKQQSLEEAKAKLESQKTLLAQQKASKENFLQTTQNNEKRYQQLLEEARREVQSLLASKFSEKRHVSRGEIIGLMGNTGFSFGPHLHFGVYNLQESEAGSFDYFSGVQDPLGYLENKTVLFDSTACDDTLSAQEKSVGGGSWSWPMSNPRITQCFGHTPWSWRYSDNFHRGVDMADKNDTSVRAVEEGEAYFYRGQTSFGNNVRIFHSNGEMTLYLHLQ